MVSVLPFPCAAPMRGGVLVTAIACEWHFEGKLTVFNTIAIKSVHLQYQFCVFLSSLLRRDVM